MEKKKTTTKKKTTKLEKIINETGKEITFEISEDGKELYVIDVKKSKLEKLELVFCIVLFIVGVTLGLTFTN
mgnify:CR=1 FL=1|tara:strand:+ start:585 stop:800 length:216 start_codon:yes stop_codon:yes gene_type:complete